MPEPQGGPPPELLAMLQQAAAGAPQGAPPQPQGRPGIDDPRYPELIKQLEQIMAAEPDPADSQALAGIIEELYKLSATRQKEMDQALGSPTISRILRRS